jgi:uncharacterized YigZ family protein
MEDLQTDNYLTIQGVAEGIYKDKGSKFIARAYHVETEEQCKEVLSNLKKEFYDARHHCYAYRLGLEENKFRSNDDGEPSGTAGKPILNQIYSHALFNVMIIVVRYFGGRKLGVSGLIHAYKTSAIDAIAHASIVKRYVKKSFSLNFDYPAMNDVMRILKEEKPEITRQDFLKECVINIDIKKNDVKRVVSRLQNLRNVDIKAL